LKPFQKRLRKYRPLGWRLCRNSIKQTPLIKRQEGNDRDAPILSTTHSIERATLISRGVISKLTKKERPLLSHKALKEIILELHQGKSVQEVKTKFDEIATGMDPAELSLIEQGLINEGLPVEEVQDYVMFMLQ
jgi:hypothetical protein